MGKRPGRREPDSTRYREPAAKLVPAAEPAPAAKPAPAANRARAALLFLTLAAATLAAYHPAWNGLLLWDDAQHITSPALRSLDGLRRIWFEIGATPQYYPAVHSVFWLEHRLWGDSTLGYHLVSIVLHALSAFLAGLILRRLAVPGAWLAAAIFALHPVHVESVAWITELKNTLSGMFCLGAALAWLRFDESRRRTHYAAMVSLFALALLSKTVTAMLPVVLLLAAWWRRGAIDLRRDLAPLAPMAAVGAAAGLLTAWVERTEIIGPHASELSFTLVERCLMAGRAVWFYLGKLVWPAPLVFVYPRWDLSHSSWPQYLYPAALVACVAALWALRRRSRAPLAALLAFCAALFPALGFVNVYPFRFSFVADHFQYLASLPMIALAAAAVTILARAMSSRWSERGSRRIGAAFALVVCSPLAVLTWHQSALYRDAATLYEATLRDNPSCWMAHVNLGVLERDRPAADYESALSHFREALRLRPDLPEAHYGLGVTLQRTKRLAEAAAEYRAAIRLSPLPIAEAHGNLCQVLRELDRLDEALAACAQAVLLRPGVPQLRYENGNVLQSLGRLAEAEEAYREALRLQPSFPEAANNLGLVLQKNGRIEQAIACHREALRLKPDFADACYYLGNALQQLGRFDEAAAQYERAIALNPGDAAAHNNLGLALELGGHPAEAAAHYSAALGLRPDLAQARANLERVSGRQR
jgi:protein O-mannosyl-transferase